MAAALTGSEILKIAAEIRAMAAGGQKICNLTVGDFDAKQFRIPQFLEDEIQAAIRAGETNYPPSDGVMALRQSLQRFYKGELGLDYPVSGILVTGGARPAIYGTYRALVDPGDAVVYPVPSWNNNHYCALVGATPRAVACAATEDFLPTRAKLEPAIRGARLLSLNSPLNPTGTAFTQEVLGDLCDMVLEENRRRGPNERPLFVMYDQVYWMLTFGGVQHVTPVALRPEMRPYTLFVDGISKPFAATGLRVGWAVGPVDLIQSMSNILGHVGAWAPRPEQVATAKFMADDAAVDAYIATMRHEASRRLDAVHDGLESLRSQGLPVECVRPQGAIYVSARFALHGMQTPNGDVLRTDDDVRGYLLNAAGLAAVPFGAFGSPGDNGWFRLSIGVVSVEEIEAMMPPLKRAIEALVGHEAGAGR
jgi:aspartate aminotransferase